MAARDTPPDDAMDRDDAYATLLKIPAADTALGGAGELTLTRPPDYGPLSLKRGSPTVASRRKLPAENLHRQDEDPPGGRKSCGKLSDHGGPCNVLRGENARHAVPDSPWTERTPFFGASDGPAAPLDQLSAPPCWDSSCGDGGGRA
ncbi:hypothetical protein IscW_ISCW006938 [Ixodes scapularis]|uniref:Uncharacterized protein n=1 Tax=Ixodes scapularis TaxID=6945 RepID=B7PW68_IXOSC|nr:hypothetical protein IscW_ISCW006938 [Ixodes scapularis]|eukprot:XP_002409385.1 hypothetical protein IscW_ISCW006938 [Ixodes scapularis]